MFSFGFYDSLNGDRKYNSVQMSEIFDGIIGDGVYDSIGELMSVSPAGEMKVSVGTGRAWFNHTWNKNDSRMILHIPEADVLLSRFDAVVLEVDRRNEKRQNSIKVIQGTPSANPAKPALLNGSDNIWQHPLAFVKVAPNTTTIAASAIENTVGTSACPFVTGVVQTADIDVLFQQWDGEFTDWFENVKLQLTDNVATNLQYQIDRCVKIINKATNEDITNGTANKWVDSAQLKATNTSITSVQQSLNTVSTSALRVVTVWFHVDIPKGASGIPEDQKTQTITLPTGFTLYLWHPGVLYASSNWSGESVFPSPSLFSVKGPDNGNYVLYWRLVWRPIPGIAVYPYNETHDWTFYIAIDPADCSVQNGRMTISIRLDSHARNLGTATPNSVATKNTFSADIPLILYGVQA